MTHDGDHHAAGTEDRRRQVRAPGATSVGIRPYGLDISTDSGVAVVANIGRNNSNSQGVSLIDMRTNPPRIVGR